VIECIDVMSISSLHLGLVRCCHLVQMPTEAATGYSQCSAPRSARLSTFQFNENRRIQCIQPEIWSRYQCLSSKKTHRENGRFCDHPGLLRFWYVCLNAPSCVFPLAITIDYSQCPGGRVVVGGGAHWLIKENLLFIDDTCYC
jgi:hypothetical protein